MASKTTSLNKDQLKSLERALADAYNFAGLQDIDLDATQKQRKDVISNIDNPSYSGNNKTKIEKFKRQLPWKLKDARVEGINDLQSFFNAIEKSPAHLKSYPNLANLKENLLNKVTVESPAPTSNPPPPARNAPPTSRTSSSRSETGSVSRGSSGSSARSGLSSRSEESSLSSALNLVPSYHGSQDSSKKSEPASPWYSMVTSLLGQNNQIQVIEKESSKKTDDDQGGFLSVFNGWGALAGGLLKKQEEGKPVDTSTAQTTQRGEVPKVAPVATKPNTQSQKTNASQYYSHSLDICRLQKKFDTHNNISYKEIQNNKVYFDNRVAKWDEELKGLHVATRRPRQKNEPRNMGFNGYVEYLDKNIEKLKLKKDDTSVNQDQLKTLIAFHYLEKAKVFYSSGKLYLGGDSFFKKQSVFEKVPEEYRSFLFDEKFKISQNSYNLPNLEKEPDPEVPQFSSQLSKPTAMSVRVRGAISDAIEEVKNSAKFVRNELSGDGVVFPWRVVEDPKDPNKFSLKPSLTQRSSIFASPASTTYSQRDARKKADDCSLGYTNTSVNSLLKQAKIDKEQLKQLYGKHGDTMYNRGDPNPGRGRSR